MEMTDKKKRQVNNLANASSNLEESMDEFAHACVNNTDNQNMAMAVFFCVVTPMCMAFVNAVKKSCEAAEAAKTEGGAK